MSKLLAHARGYTFHSRKGAEAELQRRKEALPAVGSAYQPSGKMPLGAIWWMAGGVGAAAPAGACIGLLIGLIGSSIGSAMFSLLSQEWKEQELIWYFMLTVLHIIVVLATYLGIFGVSGRVAGSVLALSGRLGKNRNATAGKWFAVIAALATTTLLWALVRPMNADQSAHAPHVLPGVFRTHWLGFLLLAIGAVIAAVVCSRAVGRSIRSFKFCENCDRPMRSPTPRPISYADAVEAVRSASANDLDAAILALTPVGASVRDGELTLFECPCCGGGYAELSSSFSTNQGINQNWLVMSRALLPVEVDVFKRPLDVAGQRRGDA